jgi:hypothetical protein
VVAVASKDRIPQHRVQIVPRLAAVDRNGQRQREPHGEGVTRSEGSKEVYTVRKHVIVAPSARSLTTAVRRAQQRQFCF